MTEQPLAQAAAALGLSTDAVRMRIRRGQLVGVRRGGRLYVQLAGARPNPTERADRTRPNRTEPETEHGLDSVHALVAELRAEVTRLAAALEREQVGSAELRRLLAAQMPALGAARAPEMPENAPETVETTAKPPRHWWQVWRR